MVNVLKTRTIAVAIAASKLQFYANGIFTTDSTFVNHAVTLIGYSSFTKYSIKNSWGLKWGNYGYGFVD